MCAPIVLYTDFEFKSFSKFHRKQVIDLFPSMAALLETLFSWTARARSAPFLKTSGSNFMYPILISAEYLSHSFEMISALLVQLIADSCHFQNSNSRSRFSSSNSSMVFMHRAFTSIELSAATSCVFSSFFCSAVCVHCSFLLSLGKTKFTSCHFH